MQMTAEFRQEFPQEVMRGRYGLGDGADAPRPVWRVHLVSRGTGEVLRLNGLPLVVFARDAVAAVASLMEARDPAEWRAEVSRVLPGREGL
jgi:hypothetical protein